ncbi:bryoporin-like [Brachionichthys hirsutus]|uniref:bryoporin-like n=1 Tax=Brachionichthys hirsutus TaxID=412623 RepID=UPI003604B168
MPETAESVSASLTTNRNCTVEINNVSDSYCLINPKVFMSSGFSQHPPQPTVRPATAEVCSFTKDDHTAKGAVGLLTYDVLHVPSRRISNRLAIMFSVPYDRNLYENRLAVGVVEKSRCCDKSLYNQMYDGKDLTNFSRSESGRCGTGLLHKANDVDVRATMSSVGRAILKVELFNRMGY